MAIRAALQRLARHPLAQPPNPENPAFRTLQVPFGASGYSVWYHYLPGGDITVVALKHQRESGFDNDE
jgi:plasmid stabilization system protein ParE